MSKFGLYKEMSILAIEFAFWKTTGKVDKAPEVVELISPERAQG